MSCRQTLLLKRLSVGDHAALETEPWQRHLRGCAVCRDELAAEKRSLALFCHLEEERRGNAQGPSWEHMAAAVAQEQRRGLRQRLLRVSTAAAVVLAAGITGVASLWTGSEPAPAQIVRLQPVQQAVLEDAMRSSLANSRVEFIVDRSDALPVAVRRNGGQPLRGSAAADRENAADEAGFLPRTQLHLYGPELQSSFSPLVTPVSNRAPFMAGR